MIPSLRAQFNASWTEAKYRDLVRRLEARTGAHARLSDQRDALLLPASR